MIVSIAIIGLVTIVLIFVINLRKSLKKEALNTSKVNYSISNTTDKEESRLRLTKIYHCSLDNLEEAITKKYQLDTLSQPEIEELVERIRKSKMQEATTLKLHPEDTGSAIVESYILKHLNK